MSRFGLLPTFRPGPLGRPVFCGGPEDAGVRVRWLGTACFVVSTKSTTVVVDPFVSRPALRDVAFRRLVPDGVEVRRRFPAKVDAVVCGHAHYDHAMDAPTLALATGAKFVGSVTAAHLARASGVPEEQLCVVSRLGETVKVGDIELSLVPSLHGRFVFRRYYLAGGELDAPPKLPAHAATYKMGGAFGIVLRAGGVTLYHNGSADLIDAELEGVRADVLLVGLAGRFGTRNYLKRLVDALGPSVIMPTHHDAFFSPLDDGLRLLPGIDLDGFASEVRSLAPAASLVLPLYDEVLAVPSEEPRGAGFVPS